MPPDVLLIVLDTARADALEPYGAPAGSSPAIADLASRGAALRDVRATSCWTLPSHASLFTGAMPRGLGLTQAPAITPKSASPVLRAQRHRMLAEHLRRSGYTTGAVSTNVWVSHDSGFETGFDRFVTLDTSRQSRLDGGRRQRLLWGLEAARAVADDGAGAAAGVLREWIDEGPASPFFWFVNVVECHSPYLPPKPFNSFSAVERLRAADEARKYLNVSEIWRTCVSDTVVPEGALGRMRQLYADSVRYADHWLEQVLTGLDEAGRLDDTLVIACSDHGENLGEGGLITHAFSLDDRLLKVPFVVAGPGAEAFEGIRSLAEVPQRLSAALGISGAPWADGRPDGDVAVSQWDPPGHRTARADAVCDDWQLDAPSRRRFKEALTCAAAGRWKLVQRDAGRQLIDLREDPLELHPITNPAEQARRAGQALRELEAALDHPAVTARASVVAEQPSAEDLSAIERQMRVLGYM
jgi:arylsulfatase A-like enzyme